MAKIKARTAEIKKTSVCSFKWCDFATTVRPWEDEQVGLHIQLKISIKTFACKNGLNINNTSNDYNTSSIISLSSN